MSRQPIRIMYVILGLETGGLEKIVFNLISSLNKDKYLLYICCLDKLGSLSSRLVSRGIKVVLVKRKPGIDLVLPFRLASLFKKEKIRIVHPHNECAYFYGLLGAKLARVPIVIYTEHSRPTPDTKRLMIMRKILSLATDKIVTVSDSLKKKLTIYEKISPHRIKVIVNGADSKIFSPKNNGSKMKKELGLNYSDLILGIVARLYPEKNHRCLLSAFSYVVKEIPNVKLIIVGDGEMKGELEKLTLDLKLDKNVIFLGNREDVPEILSIFDIFILPSLREGLPLSLIEAMAMAKPIVATNVGGNHELVRDSVNGLLVPSGDSKSLSTAIVSLLRDKKRMQIMGEAGRRFFEQNYTLDRMVKNYEDIYDSLCCSKKLL